MSMFKTTGALVLAAAALGATRCAGGDGGSGQTQEGAGTSKVVEPAAGGGYDDLAGRRQAGAAGGFWPREGKIDDLPVKLEITELTRSGDTMTLGLSLALTEGDSDSSGAQIADALDDEDQEEGDLFSMDGITLIDSTNAKRYLVARDSDARVGPGKPRSRSTVRTSRAIGAPTATPEQATSAGAGPTADRSAGGFELPGFAERNELTRAASSRRGSHKPSIRREVRVPLAERAKRLPEGPLGALVVE